MQSFKEKSVLLYDRISWDHNSVWVSETSLYYSYCWYNYIVFTFPVHHRDNDLKKPERSKLQHSKVALTFRNSHRSEM